MLMTANQRAVVLDAVAPLEGWLTPAQAARLWEEAAATAPGGSIAEIGSYRGKSVIVLASAAPAGVTVVAVDPHAGNDRGPRQIHGDTQEGDADHSAFLTNLSRAGVADRVRHLRMSSHDAVSVVTEPLDVLYIDGAHRFVPARDDIVRWGAKVAPGGTMLIHDTYSSMGVTLALLTTTVAGSSFRYEGRDGSLARYRREMLRGRERLANTARQLVPLGWFARNVVIKLLLVARLGRVARLLGHDGETWPY
jgi:predicted O-methyltransferase YrrM